MFICKPRTRNGFDSVESGAGFWKGGGLQPDRSSNSICKASVLVTLELRLSFLKPEWQVAKRRTTAVGFPRATLQEETFGEPLGMARTLCHCPAAL